MREGLVIKFTASVAFIFSGLVIPLSYNQVTGSPSSPQFATQQFPFPPLPELSVTQKSASTNLTCKLTPSLIEVEGTPQQIEGPYFVDRMPNRSDIRSDTSDGSIQGGIPLRLVLHVYNVEDEDGDRV